MPHFFVNPVQINGTEVIILGDDVKHIARVLRLGPGDLITVLDGQGQQYQVTLCDVERDRVRGEIVAGAASTTEPQVRVTVVQGLPKGDKMETVIQKGTELGAVAFWPVQTERSVVQMPEDRAVKKQERWRKIAREAAEQSRRGVIPAVASPIAWSRLWAADLDFDLILIAWEEEKGCPLGHVLQAHPQARKIAVVIGPEGGLTAEEVAIAVKRGARSVSLGPRIMRTETAALAAVTMILYQYGDYGGA